MYRGDVFNALESARIIALDGILTDRYKDGFHDGLKRALEILANEVQDVYTIIPASKEGEGCPYEQSKNEPTEDEPTEDDLLEFEAEALGYRRFGKAEEGEA